MATPTRLRQADSAPTGMSFGDAVQRWLTRDYAPLDGRVRCAFFALVLVVGVRFMLLTVPAAVRAVPPELYDGAGLFGLLVDDRSTALTLVEVLRFPLVIALVLSALGLGGRLPMLFAGLGSFVMVGGYLSGTGTGHSWYVAIVAMIVLGVTHRPSDWSLDAILANRWPRYPFGRGDGDRSALGLKLILVYAVFTLFAGACAKLIEGGWRWLDGESIRYFLVEHGAPKGSIGRGLTDIVLDHAWVAVVVSVLTIAIELCSLVTLALPGSRLLYFAVLAAAFHIGTYLLMLPEFFPQLVTYVLLIEWGRVEWRRPWHRRPPAQPVLPSAAWSPRAALAVLGVLVAVLSVSIAARIEWYPLTNIPMYSSYVDGNEISGMAIETFHDERQLCTAADELSSRSRPWYAKFYVADRLQLRIGGGAPMGLDEAIEARFGGARFWLDELGDHVLDELPCAEGALTAGAPMPATQRTVDALHAALGTASRLELVYPFENGAAATLVSSPGEPP